eukprot:7079752-Alexandrium_andersonii.AAC.1
MAWAARPAMATHPHKEHRAPYPSTVVILPAPQATAPHRNHIHHPPCTREASRRAARVHGSDGRRAGKGPGLVRAPAHTHSSATLAARLGRPGATA